MIKEQTVTRVDNSHKDTPEQDLSHNISDDDVGNGIDNHHLGQGAEVQAMRDQLSRNLEELVADAEEWSNLSQNQTAKTVLSLLEKAFTLTGQPLEQSADEEVTAVAGMSSAQ